MELVFSIELTHHVVDVLHATFAFTHCRSGVVAVTARPVPVRKKLGRKRDNHVEVFSYAVDQVARHPELVSDFNSLTWPNLVFKLTWHDFHVQPGDFDTGIEACLVVCVSNCTAIANVCSSRTVVGPLLARVSVVRPAKRLLRKLGGLRKHGILLLNAVPGFFAGNLGVLPNFVSEVSEVSVCGDQRAESLVLPDPSLAHNQHVVTLAEWVIVDSHRLQNNFRLVRDSLVS